MDNIDNIDNINNKCNPDDLVLAPEQFVIVGVDRTVTDYIGRPQTSYWKDAWRRLKQNRLALSALILLSLLVLLCIIGPGMSGYDFAAIDSSAKNEPPGAAHWFGTDTLGRDLFAGVWQGGRVSMIIGFVAAFLTSTLGCLYGGVAAYFGGKVDMIMMRIAEILESIPFLIMVIVLSLALNAKSLGTIILAMVITGWTSIAILMRGQMLQLRSMEFVMAAQGLGVKPVKIITRHIIPNMIGPIIVAITFDIPGYIFGEAFLSFIGLGIQLPATSWGALAAAGNAKFLFYPYQLLFPSIAIALTMLSFYLLGDGLRDALDPKLRK